MVHLWVPALLAAPRVPGFTDLVLSGFVLVLSLVLLLVDLEGCEPGPDVLDLPALYGVGEVFVLLILVGVDAGVIDDYISFVPASLVLGFLVDLAMDVGVVAGCD